MNFFLRQFIKTKNIFNTLFLLDQNTEKWRSLKNQYKGKRVFLIGNGPSLNETPLYFLKNEYTLCFNRFYLLHERLNWYPYFYMVIDPEVLPDISDEINQNLSKYQYSFFHSVHSNAINKLDNTLLMHHVIQVPYFSQNLPLFGSGGTVAYAGLQALIYMGFSEIYLIGVDQNYIIHETAKKTKGIRIESQKDDDPNHFDPRYFGKGRRYHQPVVATQKRMIRAFERAKSVAKSKGILIRNAGFGGKLEVYERVNFLNLFDYSKEEKYKLFCETVSPNCSINKTLSFISANQTDSIKYSDSGKGIFVLNKGNALKNISKSLENFIPFGPIEDKYIFIQRSNSKEIIANYLE